MISNPGAASEAAMAYLTGRYPALQWGEPSALRLDGGWLVEALAGADREEDREGAGRGCLDEPQIRALVMVTPEGSVEEVGAGSLSRRSAHRGLTSLYSSSGPRLAS